MEQLKVLRDDPGGKEPQQVGPEGTNRLSLCFILSQEVPGSRDDRRTSRRVKSHVFFRNDSRVSHRRTEDQMRAMLGASVVTKGSSEDLRSN